MSTIKRNILEYLDNKGISKYSFYKDTGMSRGTLDNKSGLTEENIAKFIAYAKNINLQWLLTGDGKMEKDEYSNQVGEPNSVYKLRTDGIHENQRIPLFELEASAGMIPMFENVDSKPTDEFISLPRVPKCDGAIYITGDSMYPLLKSGDIVAYKMINDFQSEIFWGEMYLISISMADESFITVKYVQKSDKGSDWIKLVSQNANHQEKDVKLSKVLSMAIVKASVRINSM